MSKYHQCSYPIIFPKKGDSNRYQMLTISSLQAKLKIGAHKFESSINVGQNRFQLALRCIVWMVINCSDCITGSCFRINYDLLGSMHRTANIRTLRLTTFILQFILLSITYMKFMNPNTTNQNRKLKIF